MKALCEEHFGPEGLRARVVGVNEKELVIKAGILPEEVVREDFWAYYNEHQSEIRRALEELEAREWVTHSVDTKYGDGIVMLWDGIRLKPPKGIDYCERLMRPWYRKALDAIKGDLRTIVVAIIISVVITVVTNLILRALGWL